MASVQGRDEQTGCCAGGAFVWRFLMYAIGRPYAILWHQKLELYGYTLCVAKGCGQVSLLLCPESSLPFASCEPAWATVTAQHRRPLRATSTQSSMHLCLNALVRLSRSTPVVVPSSLCTCHHLGTQTLSAYRQMAMVDIRQAPTSPVRCSFVLCTAQLPSAQLPAGPVCRPTRSSLR